MTFCLSISRIKARTILFLTVVCYANFEFLHFDLKGRSHMHLCPGPVYTRPQEGSLMVRLQTP